MYGEKLSPRAHAFGIWNLLKKNLRLKYKIMYQTIPNRDIDYGAVPMDTDHVLCKDIVPPLDVITNGSLILICGSSGSGKTSLLVNLISKKGKKNGYKQSFRKCFHKVVVCSPSTGTLKNNVFDGIPENQLYTEFDQCMYEIEGHLEASELEGRQDEEKKYNLLVLDDVAAALRQNRQNELLLTRLLQNRRHKNLTCILISQKWSMIPTGIRSNANVCFLFRPKTMQEQEAICNEVLPIHRRDSLDLFNFCFDGRYNNLMIDMTLKHSNKFRFFKNFEEILL